MLLLLPALRLPHLFTNSFPQLLIASHKNKAGAAKAPLLTASGTSMMCKKQTHPYRASLHPALTRLLWGARAHSKYYQWLHLARSKGRWRHCVPLPRWPFLSQAFCIPWSKHHEHLFPIRLPACAPPPAPPEPLSPAPPVWASGRPLSEQSSP